jgi:excisionase family DNA binding protein
VHGIAEELGVDVQTVRRWIQSGKLRAFKPGKEYRIRETDLEEFLAAREVRPKGSAPSPLVVPPAARPEVRNWLRAQGHLPDEEFLDYVGGLDLDVDENGFPRGIKRAVEELRRRRDAIIAALKKPGVQAELFGPPQTEGLTGDDWVREVFRPGKTARKLINELRGEYTRREAALVGYSVGLFVQGVTDDYLLYDLGGQHHSDRRHEELERERTRVREAGSDLVPTEGVLRHWLEVTYEEAETA